MEKPKTEELLLEARNFFNSIKKEVGKDIRTGKNVIYIDFNELISLAPTLSKFLLSSPEEIFQILEVALEESGLLQNPRVRLKGLPENFNEQIRNLRAKHLNHLIQIEGIVRQASEVRPQVVNAKFECPNCGTVISVLQIESKFREPTRCSCGRKGGFKLINKIMVDVQRIVIEESPESLIGGEQPRRVNVFLKEDLVEPKMEEKTTPGARVRILGILKEMAKYTQSGGMSTKFDIFLEANHIIPLEETFEELKISEEDERQIQELAADPNVFQKLADSIAPPIYGYDEIKQSLVLQLFGGVKKTRSDGKTHTRGDIHLLLVGDPGCLIGDERVILGNGSIIKIKELGKEHLQKINTLVLTGGKKRDTAEVFYYYKQQPIIEIITETGKSIKGTYNHPLLNITNKNGKLFREWKRLDEFKIGDKVAVVTSFPCTITKYLQTNFKPLNRKLGPKFRGKLPQKLNPELASFLGYLLGDGWILKSKIGFVVAESEKDITDKLIKICKNSFGIKPKQKKRIAKGRKGPPYYYTINSVDIANSLKFMKEKRVPDLILKSGNKVASSFLRWLYEADGAVFNKGRRAIALKAKNIELLRDVQILLLRFGIHSCIIENALVIKRGRDIIKFANQIGFASNKKRSIMKKLASEAESFKSFSSQRSERIVKIIRHNKLEDVFDIEIPKSQRFIANGIVSHNTAKSVVLRLIAGIAPKGRYVAGRGTTGAGLTATVVRDEFLRGWSLEAGAMVLANKGIVAIDEIEKMDPQDRSAMHEALEQQCYLPDLKITLADGSKIKIGEFVDSLINRNKEKVQKGINCEILPLNENMKILTTDFESIYPAKINKVSRHIAPNKLVKIKLNNGWEITVTPEHPCWIFENEKITTIQARNLKEGDFFPIPSELPIEGEKQILPFFENSPQLCKLLGYHITDGCYELNRGKKNGIQFCNTNNKLIDDYFNTVKTIFNINPIITKRDNRFSVRVISKKVVESFKNLDENLLEKGKFKKIPEKIMKCKREDIAFLLRSLFDGDGTVVNVKRNGCRISLSSENIELAEQVTELLLRFGIISSVYKDKEFFKVDVCGQENLLKFYQNIGFVSEKKQNRLKEYLSKHKTYRSISDIVPVTKTIKKIFKHLKINEEKYLGNQICMNCHKHRLFLQKMVKIAEEKADKLIQGKEIVETTVNSEELGKVRKKLEFSALNISKELGMSDYMLKLNEKRKIIDEKYQKILLLEIENMLSILPELREIKKLAFGKVRWSKIKSVEFVENNDVKWVYDVMVEPTHSFVSNNMILHNSVTISKANVQAMLRAETSVLAAGNPKFGRFDPHQTVASQIDIPPTLINRFDVVFVMKDIPDRAKDEAIATHVLLEHKQQGEKSIIDRELLRKYIAYAKQKINPQLTDAAVDEIKKFYVDLRNMQVSPDLPQKPLPISARQLEALVRMAEANARSRLSQKVTKEDAKRAIALMRFYLTQVGYDYETKTFDIDRIATGVSTSQRSKIMLVKETLARLESRLGKLIPIEEVRKELENKISDKEVEDALDKLTISGDIFHPRKGFVQRM